MDRTAHASDRGENAQPRSRPIPPERFPFFDKLLLIVYVVLLPPLLASKPGLFRDGDVSWHVAAGRWILEHRQVPQADPFSFTMAGTPWVAHEWLAEIVYAAAFNLASWAGLAAVVTAAVAALHLIVFLHLRPRVGPVAMLVAFVAMDVILAKFLLARPHVLVWPLMAIWTSVLLNCRDSGRSPPLPLAALMVVWTNLHGSFPIAFVIAGAIGFDAVARAGWTRSAITGWLSFGLAAGIAALLNVNGLDGLAHPLSIMGMDSLHLIQEWKPSSPATSPLFYIVFIAVLAVICLRGARLLLGETVLFLLMLALAFSQIRHQSWLAIIAAMLLAPRLAGSARRQAPPMLASPHERRLWLGGALALGTLLIAGRLLLPLHPKESAGTPLRLLASIPPELRSQPVLNEYSFGGPLILAGIRPYIDGRADMYGDRFVQDYVKMVGGDENRFRRAVRDHGIRWTILRPGQPLAKLLDASPEWRRSYQDRIGVVHVRRR